MRFVTLRKASGLPLAVKGLTMLASPGLTMGACQAPTSSELSVRLPRQKYLEHKSGAAEFRQSHDPGAGHAGTAWPHHELQQQDSAV